MQRRRERTGKKRREEERTGMRRVEEAKTINDRKEGAKKREEITVQATEGIIGKPRHIEKS